MGPLLRASALAAATYLLGLGVGAALRGVDNFSGEANITTAFTLAIVAWVLGIGGWDAWVRPWLGLKPKTPAEIAGTGWRRYFGFSTDHKVIGIQYLTTFVVVFLLAGALALLMRWELASAGESIIDAGTYNQVMSLHGILMIAVAVVAIIGGFGNYLVPLMIGAEDMAFPRLNALSFWLIPPVAAMLLLSPVVGGFDSGWTAYPPLSEVNEGGQLLFILAIITFGLSSILGALNFITTIIKMRAPGMSWGRLPIFVWSIFSASILALLVTQFFAASLLMVLLGRVLGFGFFSAEKGGDPPLYQHLFWFYSHPAVYIMILPGFGILLEVLAHFSRKPLFAYRWVVGAFIAIVVLSVVVWAHHMFTSGMSESLHTPFMILTELISIPTGVVFLSALGTVWRGKLWLKTPMLFALAFVSNFLIGGLTGIFLADVATDVHLQDTYFVVAHFHYTIMGGEIFALMAGIYYWFPKVTGKMYNEVLGKVHAVWMFLGFNAVFIPLFFVGIHGMNRRVAEYPEALEPGNRLATFAAFFLAASFIVFVWNLIYSAVRGERAGDSPWGATTLEWQVSSPPPEENFDTVPIITTSPYVYGMRNRRDGNGGNGQSDRAAALSGPGAAGEERP